MREMQPRVWKQCQICRQAFWLDEMVGRQVLVHEVTGNVTWSIHSYSFQHYEVRDVCRPCDAREEEALRERYVRAGLLVGGTSLAVWTWPYLSSWGLLPAVLVVLIGLFIHKRRNRQALIQR